METTILFEALSSSIINSLAKGLAIYFLVKLLISISPALRPDQKFNLLYGALVLIFAGFFMSFTGEYINGLKSIAPIPASGDVPATSETWKLNYNWWIGAAYCFGLTLQGILFACRFYALHLIRVKAAILTNTHWQERLRHYCRRLQIKQAVTLQSTSRVLSPFTSGFLKPAIILPIAMINQLSPAQAEAILIHELVHIKRNDYMLNILMSVMEAIMFFNPFVWLLAGDIRQEREHACDDMVIEMTGDRSAYAHALLKIAEYNIKTLEPALCAATGRYQLLRRIKRITVMNPAQNTTKASSLAIMAVCAAFSLAWITPAEATNTENNEPEIVTPVSISTVAIENTAQPRTTRLVLLKQSTLADTLSRPLNLKDTVIYLKGIDRSEWRADIEQVKKIVAETQNIVANPEWQENFKQIGKNAKVIVKRFSDPQWQEEMKSLQSKNLEYFASEEWKKHVEALKSQGEVIKVQIESEEMQQQIEELKRHAREISREVSTEESKKIEAKKLKQAAEKIRQHFESEELKKHIHELKKNSEKLKKQIQSKEWKEIQEIK